MKKSQVITVVATIVLLVVAVFLVIYFNIFGVCGSKANTAVVTTEKMKSYGDSVSLANLQADNRRLKQDISACEQQRRQESYRDSVVIAALKDVCKDRCVGKSSSNRKPLAAVKKLRPAVVAQPKKVVPSYVFTPIAPPPAPVSSAAPANPEMVRMPVTITNTTAVVSGIFQLGDFSVMTSGGYTTYSFNKRLYNAAGGNVTPELFQKGSGKYFALVGDYYSYKTAGPPSQMWCVYIGDKGFPVYLPHELLKPEIFQARGSYSGYITSSDLNKIGGIESAVGEGKIRPNRILLDTEAVPPDASNHWEGWAFLSIF